MDGNAGIRGESVEMTRSGFKRRSKNEQPTLAIENSLFVQRFPRGEAEMENVMKPTRESMVRDEEKYFLPRDGVIVVAGPSRFRQRGSRGRG